MKTSNIIKGIIGFTLLVFVLEIGSCSYTIYKINENGGVKETIIDAGKEIKDISKQIGES